MKTYKQAMAAIARLRAQAEKLKARESVGVIERIRTAIDHYGLTAADLGFGTPAGAGKRASKVKSKPKLPQDGPGARPAKYRDPASDRTWTGTGRPPAWLAGVADRSAFLIAGQDESASALSAKVTAKAALANGKGKSKAKAIRPLTARGGKVSRQKRKAHGRSDAAPSPAVFDAEPAPV